VVRDISLLLPVIPVYVGFVLLAPLMGMFAARLFALPAVTARAVRSARRRVTRWWCCPGAGVARRRARLAATAVILQTLVELIGELIYVRLIPTLVWRADRPGT